MPNIILGRVAGKSAYEYALEGGYTGSEEQFAIETASCPMHARSRSNPHEVSAAQVHARSDTWLPTPAEIGAAPVVHDHAGHVLTPAAIELTPGPGAGHGGYIDFHYNGSAADHTSRIIETNAGYLNCVGVLMENGNRVYTRDYKPTASDIGTMTTAEIQAAISAAINAAIAGAIEGGY